MLFKNFIAASAFVALAAAIPLQQVKKRDVVWETKVEEAFTTITVTTTLYRGAQSPAAQPPAAQSPAAQSAGAQSAAAQAPSVPSAAVQAQGAQSSGFQPPSPVVGNMNGHAHIDHHRHRHHRTTHIMQTITVHPSPAPSAASPPAENSPPAAATPTEAAPQSTPTQQSSGGGTSGGSSAPSSGTHSGDITYYTPGLGSCGVTNSASDMIVALAADMMEAQGVANPNDNPLCGRSITISYNGKTAQATIEDTCPGCSGASLDLTPSLFQVFAPLATGRVSGVEWWFN